MKHSPSKTKVYQSDDYSIFKLVDGNRPLNKKKIEKIISEIKKGNDVLDEVPILVKESGSKLAVLDGQHRLQIAKQLKRPVQYIIHSSEMNLYQVAKVNSNTEKWKADDFINCYSKAGNDNYKKLGEFHSWYGIGIGSCLSLLTYGIQKHDGSIVKLYTNFEQGIFEIKTWKEAVQFAELCKNFSAHDGWNTRGFLIAMSKIIRADKCELDVLMEKFNKDPKQLTHHFNWKGYINNLEEIYNKGNSKRRVIY